MNEKEWHECSDSGRMLNSTLSQKSDRKLRLFACACCRNVWDLMGEGREMVLVAERFADGQAMLNELEEAHPSPKVPAHTLGIVKHVCDYLLDDDAINSAGLTAVELERWADEREQRRIRSQRNTDYGTEEIRAAGERAAQAVRKVHCDLLREIVGNPFLQINMDQAWLTAEVTHKAQSIYESQSFQRMPELGQLLEVFGCTNDAVLGHCNSGGPHFRGCWVLDLVLKKD